MAKAKKEGETDGGRNLKRELDSANLNEVNKVICERFKIIRQQAGLTQVEFGKTLGLDAPYIKGVEQGRFAPSHPVIANLAKTYKRSIDWIYGLRD